MKNRKNRLLRVALALVLAASLLLAGCARQTEPAGAAEATLITDGAPLELYFFDAGKADAMLLTTEHSTVLIDCGEKGFGKTILAELERRGIGRVDVLIVTHFDQDHVGGAAKVINNIAVDRVLQSNQPKDSEEYEKYVTALRNAGIEAETVRDALTFTLDGVGFTVDPPRAADYDEDESNNSSLIVTVRNGQHSFVLTGDAQTERLREFLDASPGPCTLLKVPHHGKDEPLTEALLAALSPEIAVITSSDEEPESGSVTDALQEIGSRVLLTRQGSVTVRSDGTELTIDQ